MAQTQAPEKGNIAHGLYVQTVRFSIPNLWGQGQTSRASHGVGKGLSVAARRGSLISSLAPTALTGFTHSLFPGPAPHPEPFLGTGKSLERSSCHTRACPPRAPLPCRRGYPLGIWFFSASQVPFLPPGDSVAQDNEPNGISWLAEEERVWGGGAPHPSQHPASVTNLSWVLS